jgi:hypothetical protein
MVKEKRYKCFHAGHTVRLLLIVIHTNRRALFITTKAYRPLNRFSEILAYLSELLKTELVEKKCLEGIHGTVIKILRKLH